MAKNFLIQAALRLARGNIRLTYAIVMPLLRDLSESTETEVDDTIVDLLELMMGEPAEEID